MPRFRFLRLTSFVTNNALAVATHAPVLPGGMFQPLAEVAGQQQQREYLSGRMRESGHKKKMESIFSADFLAKLTQAEIATLTNFEAAATKVSRPIVRKTCRDAGFVAGAHRMETDPIFLAFQKWVRWATETETNSPTTGLVVGDTWKDFCREYCKGNQRVMYFVVEDTTNGPDNIVNGYVHVEGRLTESVLSLNNAVIMRRLLKVQLGCLVVDLEMLLLSLLFPELDGIPVLQQVTEITDAAAGIIKVSLLLTHGNGPYGYWPLIASVPSFTDDHEAVDKDLCVGQLIGLMQFSRIPRHPIKGVGSDGRSVNWALSSGQWTTTLHRAAQATLQKRRREEENVRGNRSCLTHVADD